MPVVGDKPDGGDAKYSGAVVTGPNIAVAILGEGENVAIQEALGFAQPLDRRRVRRLPGKATDRADPQRPVAGTQKRFDCGLLQARLQAGGAFDARRAARLAEIRLAEPPRAGAKPNAIGVDEQGADKGRGRAGERNALCVARGVDYEQAVRRTDPEILRGVADDSQDAGLDPAGVQERRDGARLSRAIRRVQASVGSNPDRGAALDYGFEGTDPDSPGQREALEAP